MTRRVNKTTGTVLTMALCLVVAMLALVPLVNCPPEYDPWYDTNDDGAIDLKDYFGVGKRYGATGEPIEKASIEYDSGWINITDKCGAYFTISHDLGSTDIMVDIQGKVTVDGGIHQKYYGLTSHQPMWTQTCGGINDDGARSVIQTSDGGYAVAGYTYSFGAGSADGYLVKTDASGNILWSKTYGGTAADYVFSVIQTGDGGYALAGATISSGAGSYDFYLIKTSGAGNLLWSKTYGGTNDDSAHSVAQTGDGGYAIAGNTNSFGAGSYDFWLVKTDANGNMQWSKTYGGTGSEYGYTAVQTSEGGFAIAGYTTSFGAGSLDFYLVKTDGSGNMLWSRTYGGTGTEYGLSGVQTGDGGYALAGYTSSFGAGSFDFHLVKTDVEQGLAWTDSTTNTLTLYRGATDPFWNFVRVRIWQIKPP